LDPTGSRGYNPMDISFGKKYPQEMTVTEPRN